jgi:hypothetical protein
VADEMYRKMEEKLMIYRDFARVSNSYGLNILTSTISSKPSYENRSIEHGVFTRAMLKGMSGKASPDDKFITVGELKIYIDKELPKMCGKNYLPWQPYGRLEGPDFILIKVE